MASITKIKEKIRSLLNTEGREPKEIEAFKAMAEKLMKKYNLTDKDLWLTSETSENNKVAALIWHPKGLKVKTNPDWLNILCVLTSQAFECRAILNTKRLGCTLMGENLEEVTNKLDYAIERSEHTFKTISPFYTGKNKLRKPDYLLGFAYGFSDALKEKRQKDAQKAQEAQGNVLLITGKEDALAVISAQLRTISRELATLQNNGQIEDQELKQEIKDMASFQAGYRDGRLALTNLIK